MFSGRVINRAVLSNSRLIWNKALPSEQTHKVTCKSCKIVIENNCIAWLCWCSALPCPALPCPTLPCSTLLYPLHPPSLYPTFPTIPFNLPSPLLQCALPYHLLYPTVPSPPLCLINNHMQSVFIPVSPALLHAIIPSPPLYNPLPCLTPLHSTIPYLPLYPTLPSPPLYLTLLWPTPLHSTLPSPFTLTYMYYPSLSYPALLHSILPSPPLLP